MPFFFIVHLFVFLNRVWKGILGIWDLTKIKRCGIQDLTASGKRDSPKLGAGCGKKVGCGIATGKENETRDSDTEKERESGITSPLPDPV